jgi:hypothetical protein
MKTKRRHVESICRGCGKRWATRRTRTLCQACDDGSRIVGNDGSLYVGTPFEPVRIMSAGEQ